VDGQVDTLVQPNDIVAAILVERRRLAEERNPNLRLVDSCILKDDPRAKKVATHWMILDRHTGELHHHAIKIETFHYKKGGVWELEAPNSITLADQGGDEIARLMLFLDAVRLPGVPEVTGDYLIVPVSDDAQVAPLEALARISSPAGAAALANAMVRLSSNPDVMQSFIETIVSEPDASRLLASAMNISRFKDALGILRGLVANDAREQKFQELLAKNPWMFGSEYSELLDKRHWTRDEHQDFILRKTADGYVEAVEIKRPLGGQPLFILDQSRSIYYQRSEVTEALGQVMDYIEWFDAERSSINLRDGEDILKIKARIVIGRDGDDRQRQALRRLNSHLHRVEILTFDQLLRIAERVVNCLEQDLRSGD
jgi:hypothetical protein